MGGWLKNMMLKKILGIAAAGVIVLSGCGTSQEGSTKISNEKVSASETQPKTEELPKSPLERLEGPYKALQIGNHRWLVV